MPTLRRPAHAGSWYSDSGPELSRQLDEWLLLAEPHHGPARAVIVPHAGYSYSGPTAAHGYRQIDPSQVRRIFVLGPSHHVHISSGCALTKANFYQTPLYDLPIDIDISKRLEATGNFSRMSLKTDEDEHSIEMQLPYIAKVMEQYRNQFTVIPILVGSINAEEEALYGRILAPYLDDPSNLFVISSDFCHWGRRFKYTYYDKNQGDIYQSIEHLDRMGMNIIENLDPAGFTQYLQEYGNTVCGRHPIGVMLQAITAYSEFRTDLSSSLKFLKYAQSSQCHNMSDSSVSYATASLTIR